MTKVRINGHEYYATVYGFSSDPNWENRESKSITLEMDYSTAVSTFLDDVPWAILYQGPDYFDTEKRQMVTPEVEEYDNSDYSILGDITVHRDGTVTVKMGKPTAEEINQILMEAIQG